MNFVNEDKSLASIESPRQIGEEHMALSTSLSSLHSVEIKQEPSQDQVNIEVESSRSPQFSNFSDNASNTDIN
ncbi:hypothetical protein KUTeg_021367 [Tegillarca granosa]|uniref:Uncharacterized protein n=1 Tax=Tegillarca granosa TaxID=220873 RepID=A0ABQ9EFU4_TEGGR|nr:hypothetical protein KUTeg_021367 [Tegillarca granosa]